MLTLYYRLDCPYSLRARLVLAGKALSFSRRVVRSDEPPAELIDISGGEVPVLGVIPFIADLTIPEEDAVALDSPSALSFSPAERGKADKLLDIAVLRLPHIANFDDFDPLAREAEVRLRYVQSVADLGRTHAIVVPGTKSTMADLAWLREQGLEREVLRFAAKGAAIVGICGYVRGKARKCISPTSKSSMLPPGHMDEMQISAVVPDLG